MINIVLIEPQIPPNTGNIIRLCAGSDSILHIIRPTGFLLSDKNLKRAGLDYIPYASIHIWNDLDDFHLKHNINDRHFFATTKSKNKYYDIEFQKNDYIYFGREDAGINEDLLHKYEKQNITIPMSDNIRSINLSNTVAIVMYEALRQFDCE